MSATGRNVAGHERRGEDFYETPEWATWALLDVLGGWRPCLDPCAGTGAILHACNARGLQVAGIEIDEGRAAEAGCERGDGLAVNWRYRNIIMNPPYGDALEWCETLATTALSGVALLRLGFLASAKRHRFWRHDPPDFMLVLSSRPSFAHGKTDAADYAWIGWRVGGYAMHCDFVRMAWAMKP